MDFFQFLQNSKSSDDTNLKKQKKNKLENTPKDTPKNKNKSNQFESNDFISNDFISNDFISNQFEKNEIDLYNNIKNGDMVKIIGVKGSILNSYKGYIGEIKNYKRNNDYALVFLHSISSCCNIVKFPLTHFIKIDN